MLRPRSNESNPSQSLTSQGKGRLWTRLSPILRRSKVCPQEKLRVARGKSRCCCVAERLHRPTRTRGSNPGPGALAEPESNPQMSHHCACVHQAGEGLRGHPGWENGACGPAGFERVQPRIGLAASAHPRQWIYHPHHTGWISATV